MNKKFINSYRGTVKIFIRKLMSILLLPHIIRNLVRLYKYRKKYNGQISVVILCEHIGDLIACEPVSSYLKHNQNKKVVWIVRRSYKEIITLFRDVDMVLDVDCISECTIMNWFMHSFDVHNLHFDTRNCSKYYLDLHNNNTTYTENTYYHYGSILQTFSKVGNLPALKQKPHLDLKLEDRFPELNTPFVAIHLDANEDSRKWGIKKWESFLMTYPNIKFVEIGLISHLSHVSNCDAAYCGKLSLVDIAYLIKKCTAFVGIESSVGHYANALGKPSLILMGKYKSFDFYVPYSEWDDNFYMIHHNGYAKDLPLDTVLEEFDEKILPYLK